MKELKILYQSLYFVALSSPHVITIYGGKKSTGGITIDIF